MVLNTQWLKQFAWSARGLSLGIGIAIGLCIPGGPLSTLLEAQTQDGYVAWKAIAGARGYRVQVRRQDDPQSRLLRDEVVIETYMKVDLPVGRYDIRTSPLNDFGRVTVWSQWQPLRVVISRKPELDSESDRVIMVNNRNKSSFSFSVSGNYFYKDVMKIAVRNPRTKRNLPIKELSVDEDGRRMLVEVEIAQAPEGKYDLVLSNPFGKTLVRPGFLNVSDSKNLRELSLGEYRKYVSRLTRECKTSIPDILIKRCEKYFVVLNLSDRDRADLYHYLRMTGENYQDRLSAYDYYAGVCPPVFGPGREYMRERLASHQAGVDMAEKESIARSLVRLERCGSR